MHEMGNILKADFDLFPPFLAPEGRSHWEQVRADIAAKYGIHAHEATLEIASEAALDGGGLCD